ncbi:MAG: Panacea domain-containing protein, partial [Dehalococcoidia bacterium]
MPKTKPLNFEFNPDKFREMVLFIANESRDDERFGTVKLNKVLYYADFYAYRTLGRPITGARYLKLAEGPAAREMLPLRRQMTDSGDISMETRPYLDGVQQCVVPQQPPRIELFEERELDLVRQVIRFFWNKTAREVADFSHRELGWQAAKPRETIPYETAWLSAEPLPQEAEEHAGEVA